MRVTQTWFCGSCGHRRSRQVRYAKYFPDSTPLAELAARGRCSRCGTRGLCFVEEQGQRHGPRVAMTAYDALMLVRSVLDDAANHGPPPYS